MISRNKEVVFGFYSEIMINRKVDTIGDYLTKVGLQFIVNLLFYSHVFQG